MFDFQSLCITKSPCRDCAFERNLAGFSNYCQTLSQVQALLATIISCPSKFSEYEEYPVATGSSVNFQRDKDSSIRLMLTRKREK